MSITDMIYKQEYDKLNKEFPFLNKVIPIEEFIKQDYKIKDIQIAIKTLMREKKPEEIKQIELHSKIIETENQRERIEKTIYGLNTKQDFLINSFLNEKGQIIETKVAEHLLENNFIKTMEDTEEIYIYNGGLYHKEGKTRLTQKIEEMLHKNVNRHKTAEILFHIKARTYSKREEILPPKKYIHLENGIYNLEKKELINFTPTIPSITSLPIKYNKEFDCPKIKKFLEEITNKQEDIDIIQEMIGYTLYKNYPISKAIMLVGGGANGKTTLINLIKSFLGTHNISAIALQDLESNRFASAQLNEKMANLYPDLSSKAMGQISKFKALTGNDLITVENKFGQPFTFTSYAKMIFSCNKLPMIEEDTDAVWRRWIILNFNKQFVGKEADKKLIDKITTEEELSGLFNFAIEGLERLLKKGEFSYSSTTKDVREYYIKMSDPFKAFIDERIIEKSEGFIFKEDLFGEFVAYCKENGLNPIPDNIFAKRLISSISGVRTTKLSYDGERKNAWSGIEFYKEDKNEEYGSLKPNTN